KMAESHTRLNKITHFGDSTLTSTLQDNLIEFFDWGLLNIGGFVNVNIPTSGLYGGSQHQLRLVNHPYYASGQVWEGFRSSWVWQSGLSTTDKPKVLTKLGDTGYTSRSTPGISGVFISNTFQPTSGVGSYKHYVDYPNGRIVFDSAISTSSEVTAEFSYKWVNVVPADNKFFREIQYRSQRADGDFTFSGSGDYTQLAENRLQLPALAVEMVGRASEPYALGGGTHFIMTDVLFHVLAEESYTRDKIIDIVSAQEDKTLYMIDVDDVGRSGAYPLDYRGATNSGALRYPDLVKQKSDGGYRYIRSMRLQDATSQTPEELNPNLYHGTVRLKVEVIQ
ncbi:hypothetical protein CMO96_01995, partial [Candidatus Woesebacteria bacterium]|nr:hypothetical protein [Candidatus Woesebacteria bacterium]